MELLERGSLDDRMTRLGKLPEKEVLEIGIQIAGGLRAAHRCGLLHRDIKPGNILFNNEGVPKLVDFGLARGQPEAAEEADHPGGMVWGTPYYIAPEKLRGQSEDFRSDMYSLGASLYHALAGHPPFEPAAPGVAALKAATPAAALAAVAPGVQEFTTQIIEHMLAKNLADRYESYDALIHDLHEAERRLRGGIPSSPVVSESAIPSVSARIAAWWQRRGV